MLCDLNRVECRVGLPRDSSMHRLYHSNWKILPTHFEVWKDTEIDERLDERLRRMREVNIDVLSECCNGECCFYGISGLG